MIEIIKNNKVAVVVFVVMVCVVWAMHFKQASIIEDAKKSIMEASEPTDLEQKIKDLEFNRAKRKENNERIAEHQEEIDVYARTNEILKELADELKKEIGTHAGL